MPDQQQDFVTQFRALPSERQTALIAKMSPEQKAKLSAAIKANPQQSQASAPGAKGSGATEWLEKQAVGVVSGIGGGALDLVQSGINLANKVLPSKPPTMSGLVAGEKSQGAIPSIPKEY